MQRATRGSTGRMISVFLPDSASTVGAGKTALTNASAGLIIAVRRELSSSWTVYSGANILAVTTVGTWLDPGAGKVRFGEEDATNAPGIYHLQFVDSLFNTADGSRELIGYIQATGIAPVPFSVDLEAINPQDAVRAGLTAIPNVASGGDGSIMVRGATQQVTLQQLAISNPSGNALDLRSTGGGGNGLYALGEGAGAGAKFQGGDTAPGIQATGNIASAGISAVGQTIGIHALAAVSGDGIRSNGAGATGRGIYAEGQAQGLRVNGSGGSGSGLYLEGGGQAVLGLWEMLTSLGLFGTVGSIGKLLVDRMAQVLQIQQARVPTSSSVNDAAATTTQFIAAAGLSSVNNFYARQLVVFTSGALAGQCSRVSSYTGATRTFVLSDALTSAPANGVTFVLVPLAGGPTAAEIDTQLSGTHGSGAWGPAGASGARTITVTVRDSATLANLPDALVTVKDSTNTTTVDQKRTDANGQAVFSLDDATYKVSVVAQPGYSSLAAQTLVVDGNETVTYSLDPLASNTPSPGTRTVNVYVYGPTGAAVSGKAVTARVIADLSSIDSAVLLDTTTSGTSDANGRVQLQLVTSDQFTNGDGYYEIKIEDAGTYRVQIPAGSGAVNLEDLL